MMDDYQKLMQRKLSRRQRRILKWCGPNVVLNIKEYRQTWKKDLGGHHCDDLSRLFAYISLCRMKGKPIGTMEETEKRAGIHYGSS